MENGPEICSDLTDAVNMFVGELFIPAQNGKGMAVLVVLDLWLTIKVLDAFFRPGAGGNAGRERHRCSSRSGAGRASNVTGFNSSYGHHGRGEETEENVGTLRRLIYLFIYAHFDLLLGAPFTVLFHLLTITIQL